MIEKKKASILGAILQIGTVAATFLVGNPALAVGLASAFGGGTLGKFVGQALGSKVGRQLEHTTGPAGAIATPLAVLPLADAAGIDFATICASTSDKLAGVCSDGTAGAFLSTGVALLGWHLFRNLGKTIEKNP